MRDSITIRRCIGSNFTIDCGERSFISIISYSGWNRNWCKSCRGCDQCHEIGGEDRMSQLMMLCNSKSSCTPTVEPSSCKGLNNRETIQYLCVEAATLWPPATLPVSRATKLTTTSPSSSTSPSSTSKTTSSDTTQITTGEQARVISAGVIGGISAGVILLFVALIMFALFLYWRKRKLDKSKPDHTSRHVRSMDAASRVYSIERNVYSRPPTALPDSLPTYDEVLLNPGHGLNREPPNASNNSHSAVNNPYYSQLSSPGQNNNIMSGGSTGNATLQNGVYENASLAENEASNAAIASGDTPMYALPIKNRPAAQDESGVGGSDQTPGAGDNTIQSQITPAPTPADYYNLAYPTETDNIYLHTNSLYNRI